MFAAIAGAAMSSGAGKSLMSGASSQLTSSMNMPGNVAREGISGPANILGAILSSRHNQAAYQDYIGQLRQGITGEQAGLKSSIGFLSPFQQHGAAAGTQELAMLQAGKDPTAMVNQILSGFQQSGAQKATIQAGLTAAQSRMGAQGLGGSGAEAKALEQFAQQQTAGQQQQFLQSVIGARGQTLSGLGQLGGFGLGAAQTETQAELETAENIAKLRQSVGAAQAKAEAAKGGLDTSIIGSVSHMLESPIV
jgi:hypothetical protein